MRITESIRIEKLTFRLKIEDVRLTSHGYQDEFVPEMILATFVKYAGETWTLGELLFVSSNFIRQAWPCPVPDDVQSWIDAKLAELRGGESVRT